MARLDIKAQSEPALDVTKKTRQPELRRFWTRDKCYWLGIINLQPELYVTNFLESVNKTTVFLTR
jgi:hypothetical protein